MELKRALKWREKYFYSPLQAKRAVQFFETQLQHIDGALAGFQFKLEPWQRRTVRRIFGWLRRDDPTIRKHRRAYIFVPKGNGKSPLGSGFALFLFAADQEPGAEVVCAAATRDQADIVFSFARENVLRNPKLRSLVGKPYRRSMAIPIHAQSFKVISSEARSKHGNKLHGLIIDELHAIGDRNYIETLLSGVGKRPRSLTVFLTTAGYDQTSIGYEIHDHACKVRDGIFDDPELLPVIYGADPEDDWTKRETWKKANPNFNVSIKENDLALQCRQAQQMPTYENTFKRLFLNIWTQQDVRWIPMDRWDACGSVEISMSELASRPCWGGLDLSSVDDVSAFVLAFAAPDNSIDLLPFFWVPADTMEKRELKGGAPYATWQRQGFVRKTPGNAVDYDFIRRDINEIGKIYPGLREIAFDAWQALQVTTQLAGDGFNMVPFRQGFASMSAPCKHLETLLLSQKLRHGKHPVLRWMANNVSVEIDAAGNIKPSKKTSKEKIDGIVATIMALGRFIVSDLNQKSIYDTRPLIWI